MLKFLAGWKAYAIGGALILAFGFTSGWVVNGWRHSASELGKLRAALDVQVEKMTEQNRIAVAHLATLEQINTQARANSRRIGQYVEATNACRVSDADRRVFIGSATSSEN